MVGTTVCREEEKYIKGALFTRGRVVVGTTVCREEEKNIKGALFTRERVVVGPATAFPRSSICKINVSFRPRLQGATLAWRQKFFDVRARFLPEALPSSSLQ